MTKKFYSHKKISNKRYREIQGLCFEDFEVGAVFEHRPGRTLTETDNIWQTLLCMNTHPLHFDKEYAARTEFKRPLISSPIVLAIVTGMSVKSTSALAIANLGWDEVKLLAPVFVGDTLYAESKILSKRLSKSRKNNGVIVIRSIGFNQHKKPVISFKRSFLVPSKKAKLNIDNGY